MFSCKSLATVFDIRFIITSCNSKLHQRKPHVISASKIFSSQLKEKLKNYLKHVSEDDIKLYFFKDAGSHSCIKLVRLKKLTMRDFEYYQQQSNHSFHVSSSVQPLWIQQLRDKPLYLV